MSSKKRKKPSSRKETLKEALKPLETDIKLWEDYIFSYELDETTLKWKTTNDRPETSTFNLSFLEKEIYNFHGGQIALENFVKELTPNLAPSVEEELVVLCAQEIEAMARELVLEPGKEACISMLCEGLFRVLMRFNFRVNDTQTRVSPQYVPPKLPKPSRGQSPSVDFAFSWSGPPDFLVDIKAISPSHSLVEQASGQILQYMVGSDQGYGMIKAAVTDFLRWDFYVLDFDLDCFNRQGRTETQFSYPPTITTLCQKQILIDFNFHTGRLTVDNNFRTLIYLLDSFMNMEFNCEELKEILQITQTHKIVKL